MIFVLFKDMWQHYLFFSHILIYAVGYNFTSSSAYCFFVSLYFSFSLHEPVLASSLSYMCATANFEGLCLLGNMPMELLYLSWEKSPNLKLGERAEIMTHFDMHSCFVKVRHLLTTLHTLHHLRRCHCVRH